MLGKDSKKEDLKVTLNFKLPIYAFLILLTIKGLALCKLLPVDGISWTLVFLIPLGIAAGIVIIGIIILYIMYIDYLDHRDKNNYDGTKL